MKFNHEPVGWQLADKEPSRNWDKLTKAQLIAELEGMVQARARQVADGISWRREIDQFRHQLTRAEDRIDKLLSILDGRKEPGF